MNDGALIDLVRQYNFLFDRRHTDFKNKTARENAWRTIAEIMEESGIL